MADPTPNPDGTTPSTTPTQSTGGTTPPTVTPEELAQLRARAEAAEKLAKEGRAAQEELERIRAENAAAEQKRLQEQGEWKTLAERRAEEVKAKDRQILSERIRSVAQAAGVIDPELADMITADDTFMVNGRPDAAKVQAAVDAFKTSKPHFFKQEQPVTRTGAGTAPNPAATTEGQFDFRKLNADASSGKASTAKALGEADALFNKAKTGLKRS